MDIINTVLIIFVVVLIIFFIAVFAFVKNKHEKEIQESAKKTEIAIANAKLYYIENKEQLKTSKEILTDFKNN